MARTRPTAARFASPLAALALTTAAGCSSGFQFTADIGFGRADLDIGIDLTVPPEKDPPHPPVPPEPDP